MGGGSTADYADTAMDDLRDAGRDKSGERRAYEANRAEDQAKRDREARKRRIAAREKAKASKPKKVERVPK
jgi:hypothetical protein